MNIRINYYLALTLALNAGSALAMIKPEDDPRNPRRPRQALLKPTAKPAPAIENITKTCEICADEKQAIDFRTLSCGHNGACVACLKHIAVDAIEQKRTTTLRCPNAQCKQTIDVNDLKKIVYDKNKHNELSDIQLKEWLIQQKTTKRCPTTNCSFSFINERADQFTTQCPQCKKEYCAKCLTPHSATVTCKQAEADKALVNDKNAQERAVEQWKREHTRECPQCNSSIEKNEGCNHMTCRSCKHEFCWKCLRPYAERGHGPYNCDLPPVAPLAPQQQPEQQEAITAQNFHRFFARDPQGFANQLIQGLKNVNYAERFMRLSCEQHDQWLAEITQFIESNPWPYNEQIRSAWLQALERLEPFAVRISHIEQTDSATNTGTLIYNRPVNVEFREQFMQYIVNQNPNDMILINNDTFETSLSREQFQAILDRASAHFRNYRFEQEAPQARLLSDVNTFNQYHDRAITLQLDHATSDQKRREVRDFLRRLGGLVSDVIIRDDNQSIAFIVFHNTSVDNIITRLNEFLRNQGPRR